jgi:hypothetical protein
MFQGVVQAAHFAVRPAQFQMEKRAGSEARILAVCQNKAEHLGAKVVFFEAAEPYAPDKKGVEVGAVNPLIIWSRLHGRLEHVDGRLGVPGFHVGQSQKTHGNGIFSVPFEGLLEKTNRLVVRHQDKAGPAGEKVARRRPGFKGDVVVQGGQGAGIVFDRVQGPAEKKKRLGGAFVFGNNFLKYRNRGFVIPRRSGFYRLSKF